ncbi:hypothetical protein ACT17_15320 [Mycolicibacterium conceptionense]|uniref:Uncharacterized protein n=1 Tax=Mycolicibacterium conceptionense TaxID=451644 RepID=A0A0J8UB96_9MYCO|nr:hypothetical protein [Mycolicibacterium conceptionense]KMV17645.1 hypothetical protein ACT17_15320 [Mycolicibacterium conceptionense]
MPMTPDEIVATELPVNRRTSQVGTPQRHYMVIPGFSCSRGLFVLVAVVPGADSTYVFEANGRGDIVDFDPIAIVGGTTDHAAALKRLGLRVDPADSATGGAA